MHFAPETVPLKNGKTAVFLGDRNTDIAVVQRVGGNGILRDRRKNGHGQKSDQQRET